MQLIEIFVHNPVKVSVGVLLFVLFGFIGLLRMPMQMAPEVQVPTVTISTRWPGAAPQEVEREIVQEQEEQLKGVEGVKKMSSECMNSQGTITLEFAVGTDLDSALLKVSTRLQQVPQYPEDADEPVISTSGSNDSPIAWFVLRPRVATAAEIGAFQQANPDLAEMLESARLAHNSGLRTRRLQDLVEKHPEIKDRVRELLPPEIDVPQLRLFAENHIEAAFERVEGVSNSNVFGGQEEEMQVIIDPERLAARQLTIGDLRRALREENRDTTAGDIWEGKRRYVVRVMGQFTSPRRVADVIIARRDGLPVYVRDVAEVKRGFKKPTGLVKNFGMSCMMVNCVRETGANVLDTMAGLREVCARLNQNLLAPRGLELVQVYDETDYIYSAIGLVNQNIVVGGILTIAVLLLFLRSGRSTIVIALAIPTSLISTFLMLNVMGRSLNVISLAGLAFAVGMLVDNSVVVLENIFRHYQAGEAPFVAAVRGAKEVWGAVVASTLTTLAVFLPVLFVEEEAGQLFRDIALAISSAVALSLLVSITVIPTAAARILRGRVGAVDEGPPGPDGLEGLDYPWRGDGENDAEATAKSQGSLAPPGPDRRRRHRAARLGHRALSLTDRLGSRFVDGVVSVNASLQRSTLLRVVTVVGFVAAAILLSWALVPKVEYLPTGNRNLVFGRLLPPAGYNLDRLLELGERLENGTRPYWDVDRGDPANEKLAYPAIDDYFFVASGRGVFFGLRAVDPLRAGELVELVGTMGNSIPGTIAYASQASLFGRSLSGARTIDVEITGPDPQKLVELGERIRLQVVGVPGDSEQAGVVPGAAAIPIPSLDLSSPELHVRPRWEQAADLGLSKSELDYAVDALVDGAYAGDYFQGGEKIDLTIIGEKQFVERTQDLESLPIATPSGALVSLAAAADDQLAGGPEQINHRERQRAITIQVRPPDETPLEQAINDIDDQIVQPLRDQGTIGGEYRIQLAGTADKLKATWHALRWNFLLALLITYLLMAALFESWLYPLVIILSVPLGAVGGLAGLWLLNRYLAARALLGFSSSAVQSLDVLTMLGFVILIGTVVNNAILIVHQSLNHMREEGMDPNHAILASVRTRIRPIFMTTSTTVLGLSPLVLFPGAGSELYRGLGAVVLGGLVVSTAFTLVLVPTFFSLAMEAKARVARLLGFDGQAPTRPVAAEPQEAVAAS
jgi:HAE1 family hydrophobic/amphiphilic exporter-1